MRISAFLQRVKMRKRFTRRDLRLGEGVVCWEKVLFADLTLKTAVYINALFILNAYEIHNCLDVYI